MKIAYCIFGQLRDEHLSFVHTARLAADCRADVFISTWSRRGTKATGIIDSSQAERMFGTVTASVLPESLCSGINFNRAIPGFAELINDAAQTVEDAELRSYFPDAVIDIEDETLCLDFEDPNVTDTNSIRMLYKIWRCNELKRRAEKRSGVRYDAVVSFRADVVPVVTNIAALLESLPDGAVHIPNANPSFLSDVLAISNSATANILASLFGKVVLSPQRRWDMIHHELAAHLAEAGVTVRSTNFLPIQMDPMQQGRNRTVLASVLADKRYDPGFYPSEAKWLAIRDLVDIAMALASDQGDGDLQLRLSRLDPAEMDLEMVASCLHVLKEHAFKRGDQRAYCTAMLHGIVVGILLSGGRDAEQYIARKVSLDTVASLLLSLDNKTAPGQLFRSIVLEPTGMSPELSGVVARIGTLIDRRDIVDIADSVCNIMNASVNVRSAQFHHLLRHEPTADLPLSFARQMVLDFPDDWRSHENVSYAQEHDKNHLGARDAAREALACNPHNPGLMTRLGMMCLRVGDYSEAEDMFTLARSVWIDERPWGGLAEALLGSSRTREAAEVIATGLTRFPASEWLARLKRAADQEMAAEANA